MVSFFVVNRFYILRELLIADNYYNKLADMLAKDGSKIVNYNSDQVRGIIDLTVCRENGWKHEQGEMDLDLKQLI